MVKDLLLQKAMNKSSSRMASYLVILSAILTVAFPFTASGTVVRCAKLYTDTDFLDRPIVYLDVTSQIGNATNSDSRNSFPIRIVTFQSGNQKGHLHALTGVDIPNHSRLHLSIETARGKKTVLLPEAMSARILDYLRLGRAPSSPFDCNCFAHYMNGVDYLFGKFDRQKWVVEPMVDESSLKEGDTIIIGHDRQMLTHFAIYLGEGYYLSKFGSSGPLIVADLPAMKIGFGGEVVFRTHPIAQPH